MINIAVRALYSYKGAANYKDLSPAAGMHQVNVSQALSASRDVGLTESAGKRGLYRLTSRGEEYARLLSYDEEQKCRDLLKEVLLENPLWSEVIKFLEISANQERSPLSLVADVERKRGKRWSQSLREGYARAYVSVLEFAGLVKVSGSNIISLLGKRKEETMPAHLDAKNLQPAPALPQILGDFAELSISDYFKVLVKRDLKSLEFFERQVKKDSMLVPWILQEKEALKEVSKKANDK